MASISDKIDCMSAGMAPILRFFRYGSVLARRGLAVLQEREMLVEGIGHRLLIGIIRCGEHVIITCGED